MTRVSHPCGTAARPDLPLDLLKGEPSFHEKSGTFRAPSRYAEKSSRLARGLMATRPGATARSTAPSTTTPHEKVRIETALTGKDHWHETTTELFRRSIDVELRGDQVKLKMDVVRIIMGNRMARDLVAAILGHLEPEQQWAIILQAAEELENRGIFRPRR